MKARIKYCPNYHGKEGYTVEIFTEGEWGLDSFYPLVRREGAGDEEDRNFLHFGIVNKIAQLSVLGYTIMFK